MTGELSQPARALESLRADHPGALYAAITHDGIRVAMPASVGLAEHQLIPVPDRPSTMIDVAVAEDVMRVADCWYQVLKTGVAETTLRTRYDPAHTSVLTFIDLRPQHPVLLGVLTTTDAEAAPLVPEQRGALAISARPRTGTMRKTVNGVITAVDERTTAILGWPAERLVGCASRDLVHPDDQARALDSWLDMIAERASRRVRLRHRCLDGGWLWVELENTYQPADRPDDAVILTLLNEIDDEMTAYEALDRQEQLLHRITTTLPTGLLQLEIDRSVAYCNPRLAQILRIPETSPLRSYLEAVADGDRPALDAALTRTLHGGDDEQLEIEFRTPGSGEQRRCAITLIALTDREGAPGALMCVDDITESARMRAELEFKATYDPLTGCHNRNATMAALHNALAEPHGRRAGVIFIDLDKFKPVNDTLGHAAGDELLIHTATTLAAAVRKGDFVGRIGGDEFLLICPAIDGPDPLLATAHRVHAALHGTVRLAAGEVATGASIGCALARPGDTDDTLVAAADAAMYESKRRGGGLPVLAGD
jgi:diguanylate cyclase (GGDEF)-like protein/PAS domain S-box-containing protein